MHKSLSFRIACCLMLTVLFIDIAPPLLTGRNDIVVAGVGIEGIARFLSLGIIVIILADHLHRFSFVFQYEQKILFLLLFFLLIVMAQLIWVDEKFFNAQGAIKYLFYFGFIAISFYSAIVHSDQTIHTLLNICFVLFLAVLVFYPYLIISSGQDIITRFLNSNERMSFLLKAANEDAHFMTTFMMFAFVKLRKRKLWLVAVAFLFYVALIYNGTRSAFVMAFILPVVYYVLYKRNIILSSLIIVGVVLLMLPYLSTFIETKFSKDLKVLEESDKVLSGKGVGGNLSWRIAHVWVPTVNYTWEHSPWVGNGSNGWNIISAKVLSNRESASPHNFFVWAFVNWGIIGVILLLALMSIPVLYVWKAYIQEKNKDDLSITIALMCAWIQFFVWSFIANSFNFQGWVVLSLLIVFSIAIKYKDFSRNLISLHESIDYQHT